MVQTVSIPDQMKSEHRVKINYGNVKQGLEANKGLLDKVTHGNSPMKAIDT